MTATIQEAPTVGSEEAVDIDISLPLICEAAYDNGDVCDNLADYRTRTRCCGHVSLWCEDCLFEFFDYCKYFREYLHNYACGICGQGIDSNIHIIVTGRVR